MDQKSFEQLRARTDVGLRGALPRDRFIHGIEQYLESGEPYLFWMGNVDEFNNFTDLLDITSVDGAIVIETAYRNPTSEIERTDPTPHEGSWTARGLLSAVADRNTLNVTFVNDFESYATIALDDTTVVTLGFEQRESPGICDACCSDEDYMEHNSDYNCEHGVRDEYNERYIAVIYDRSQLEELRPENGSLF